MTDRELRPGEALEHYVNEAPFDPYRADTLTPEQERYYQAPEWKIMWWKFRRHRVAVWSGAFLLAIYFSILIAEFITPYNLHTRDTGWTLSVLGTYSRARFSMFSLKS